MLKKESSVVRDMCQASYHIKKKQAAAGQRILHMYYE